MAFLNLQVLMILIKSDKEIQLMRRGGRILARILDELEKKTRPGVVTADLNNLAEDLAKKFGAKPSFKSYRNYPASLCVSVNSEVVHGLPKKRILREGDIVGLDFGLLYKGYYTDIARTVGVGKISSLARKLIFVTKKALDLGISQVKPGNHIGDIAFAIQNYVESKGFSVVRDLVGHGVGKKVHEPPQVPNFGKKGTGIKLEKGMTIAIEPMVNVGSHEVKILPDGWTFVTSDGGLSCHFEHTVAVTEDGFEILTKI
jgi:methionyl aminopeptidase